ncbi:acylaminoacyl-peptidase [Jatrophihabitans sp. GAS493]|uniref:S9 family peptidase n=1 Tax=Jatrophihabitans sp. GAS493 TaxID=1907575 RepID=UPI000BB6A4DC|nr:alpha/beta fold hydrolase [Jatrophihabitans sp. GAS493]SOD73604.1 acylaminoacyl-peptidase [Jatrophihabitans sp. GAS493]
MELAIELVPPTLPSAAELAPHRQCTIADAGGRCEVFTLDTTTGRRRQVTNRTDGTTLADIDPAGRRVWWFDDDLAGVGRWFIQPFAGGADTPALPEVPAGRHAGLAMSTDGTAAIGLADEDGFDVYLRLGDRAGGDHAVEHLLRRHGAGELIDLSSDATLLATAAEPESSAAVEIHPVGGGAPVQLSGERMPLWASGFGPGGASATLLLTRQTELGYQVGTWTFAAGCTYWPEVFDTEISTSWCPDGSVLIRQDRHARSRLTRLDPTTGRTQLLPTARGTILDAQPHSDGEVHYLWTDAATPPVARRVLLREAAPQPRPRESNRGAVGELWADGPGGPVHTLWLPPEPAAVGAPWPTVFLLHGGPHQQDRDAYDPAVAMLNAAGLAVARVNYRGSSGYGPRWRNDFSAGVGLTQLADVSAARDELVARGWADADAVAIAGWSWGGYLALLAAGVQPDRWRAAAAAYPIADYPQAYAGATTELRALDERLFGGPPQLQPERYRQASPASYIAQVKAPILLVAGRYDLRCPAGQIESYADELTARGGSVRLIRSDAGHGVQSGQASVDELVELVTFLAGQLHDQQVTALVGSEAT